MSKIRTELFQKSLEVRRSIQGAFSIAFNAMLNNVFGSSELLMDRKLRGVIPMGASYLKPVLPYSEFCTEKRRGTKKQSENKL